MNKINDLIKSLQLYRSIDIQDLWKQPDLTTFIFKNNNVLKLFINYLIQTHQYNEEIFNYAYSIQDISKMIDEFYFYEGMYTRIKLTNIDDKKINEILIFNQQPTKDEHFNEIFNKIKHYSIDSYEPIFDDIYINARLNDLNFSFIKANYNHDVPKLTQYTNHLNFKYDPSFSNQFIMKCNYNNECFKRAFFILCSLNVELNFKTLLNTFINFESLFYSKVVQVNKESSNLITYIYFKNDNEFIPNLRYTLDIPGEDILNKIEYLKHVEPRKTPGFYTEITFDDKGIYFNTKDYNINEITKQCDEYINNKQYDSLLYYIFNSQFLSRSTCLFGYYVYYKLTGMIPDVIKYYDIIALISDEKTFTESLKFKEYKHADTTNELTLNQIIEFIS